MARKARVHHPVLAVALKKYAAQHGFYYTMYSAYHMRVIQKDMVCLDVWTTGKYYIVSTEYVDYGAGLVERAGEKGQIPLKQKQLHDFLNKLFYPIDYM